MENMEKVVYLDNAATTPCAPEALEMMVKALSGACGNPSSHYSIGYEAKEFVDTGRTLNRNQRENGEKPVAAETVPDQKASGRSIPRYNVYRTRSEIGLRFLRDLVHQLALY